MIETLASNPARTGTGHELLARVAEMEEENARLREQLEAERGLAEDAVSAMNSLNIRLADSRAQVETLRAAIAKVPVFKMGKAWSACEYYDACETTMRWRDDAGIAVCVSHQASIYRGCALVLRAALAATEPGAVKAQ